MKVIDLLNKIANDEIDEETRYKFSVNKYIVDEENLNLEIIEENNKIEKIKDKYCSQISKVELAQKINEIIDKLNKGE